MLAYGLYVEFLFKYVRTTHETIRPAYEMMHTRAFDDSNFDILFIHVIGICKDTGMCR